MYLIICCSNFVRLQWGYVFREMMKRFQGLRESAFPMNYDAQLDCFGKSKWYIFSVYFFVC